MEQLPNRYHSKRDLADRWRVATRTVDRWRLSGLIPPPDMILPGGQQRWSDTVITAHERAAVRRKRPAPATETAAVTT